MTMLLTPNQIRALRKRLKMNSTAFATLLGVTTNAVARWELGDRRPRIETHDKMNELAKANGIDVQTLDQEPVKQPA